MKVNYVALTTAIIILVTLLASLWLPWWQLTVGSNLISLYASPINVNVALFGQIFTLPIIWALNLIFILSFALAGIVMMIYAFVPAKPYAKDLLGFSWRKPLYALIMFVIALIITVVSFGFLGLTIPIMGTADLQLPAQLMKILPLNGVNISGTITAGFQLPFYLGVAAAVMCVVTRLTAKKFAAPQQPKPSVQSQAETANLPPPPPPAPMNS